MVTQYEMHGVEDLGLLKMDFLGLRNLDVMEIALDLIERVDRRAPRHRQPAARRRRRPSTCLQRADTMGVFQLEGAPMRALLRSLDPDHVRRRRRRDRAVPAGPDGAELAQRVRRPQERPQAGHVRPPRPRGDPRPHLRADDLPGAADARRRRSSPATRSKRPTTCARRRARRSASSSRRSAAKFVEGCVAQRAHRRVRASSYFDTIEPFADYSFNKSHSVGYGYITYQTAWLKANHPVPYLAALLTSVKSNLDKAAVYLNDCRQRTIAVLVPDVNASASDFACELAAVEGEQDAIRFGLSAVRNVGEGVSELIIAGARRRAVRRLLRLLRARRPDACSTSARSSR